MASPQGGMQPNHQQVHDDLASLFTRHMTLSPGFPSRTHQPASGPEASPSRAPAQPALYSVSQHYHHSAHCARPASSSSQLAQQQPRNWNQLSLTPTPETILQNNGIDISYLTPAQLQLFRTASAPQKLRLIELWTICPPTAHDMFLSGIYTSLGQEEDVARMRYGRIKADWPRTSPYPHTSTSFPLQGSMTSEAGPDATTWRAHADEDAARLEKARELSQERPTDVYRHFGIAIGGPNFSPAADAPNMGSDAVFIRSPMSTVSEPSSTHEYARGSVDNDRMDI